MALTRKYNVGDTMTSASGSVRKRLEDGHWFNPDVSTLTDTEVDYYLGFFSNKYTPAVAPAPKYNPGDKFSQGLRIWTRGGDNRWRVDINGGYLTDADITRFVSQGRTPEGEKYTYIPVNAHKFKPGDRVVLARPQYMRATASALATVDKYAFGYGGVEYLYVVWDRTNDLVMSQADGGYLEKMFDLAPALTFKDGDLVYLKGAKQTLLRTNGAWKYAKGEDTILFRAESRVQREIDYGNAHVVDVNAVRTPMYAPIPASRVEFKDRDVIHFSDGSGNLTRHHGKWFGWSHLPFDVGMFDDGVRAHMKIIGSLFRWSESTRRFEVVPTPLPEPSKIVLSEGDIIRTHNSKRTYILRAGQWNELGSDSGYSYVPGDATVRYWFDQGTVHLVDVTRAKV